MRRIKLIQRSVYICLFVSTLFFMTGCGGAQDSGSDKGELLYQPQYALGYTIHKHGNSSIVSINNPWQGAEGVEFNLFLERDGDKAPADFKGVVTKAPLKSVVCMSSSYVAFIDQIGEVGAVKGVSGARYITNPVVKQGYKDKEVREVGYDANVNFELIASLQPDLVMIYGLAGENSSLTLKFNELSIPYIYIGDYLEQSPLGKAEWLVAIGEMFDKREMAEKKFSEIESSYVEVKNLVEEYDESSNSDKKPVIMLNAPFRDTWFVPGDRNYMVRLIEDAGGAYACAGDDSDISKPISGESAYVHAYGADIWLNPGQVKSMDELKSLNPKFLDIPMVRNGEVYNNNARTTEDGGSDFWESGAVRPDIVLKDLVKIINPDLDMGEEYQLYYYMKLE